jgi:PST family polysaccharide transporter
MSMTENPAGTEPTPTNAERTSLAQLVRRGLGWGLLNSLVLRLGSLLLGIILARLLTPSAFGVFAVALTIQSILMTLADLGLSTDLIRSRDWARKVPTASTLGLASGIVLAAVMCAVAAPLAMAMSAPAATPVIAVMSLTLVLSGLGVAPNAALQRNFDQKKLFACAGADFAVGTSATLLLVAVGMGPLALAVGRILAQAAATALQFRLSGTRPRFGLDRGLVKPLLRFGLPLAAANLLSWLLLNIDNIVIARIAGEVALGFYVLAFNVSNWPMNAIGTAIRSVSLAAFSRMNLERSDNGGAVDAGLSKAVAVAWAAALPAGTLLAVLSTPLVTLLYGEQWTPSAAILAALGFFGALRVVFDLMATYLMAHGAAKEVFWIQALWIVALTPLAIMLTTSFGPQGTAWAHVVVGTLVILPAYLWVLRRVGADLPALLKVLWPPPLAAAGGWISADMVARQFANPAVAVILGGAAGVLTYAALAFRWLRTVSRTADPDRGNSAPAGHNGGTSNVHSTER